MLLDASDGHDVWGSIGVSRERHRGLLGGARRLARVRDAAGRARARRARRGAQRDVTASPHRGDPARAAGPRRRGGGGGRSRSCAPASSRSARACRSSSRRSRRGSASPHASAVSSGTAGLHLALRAVGVQRRRRGRHVARSRSSRRPTSIALRARAAGLRRHRPGHAQPRPGGRRGRGHRRARARCCRSTSSATRPTCRRSRRLGPADRRGRLRGARRRPRRRRRRSAAAAIRPSSASTPTSSSRRARAAWSRSATRRIKERIDSERNQGRAPDMGWLDHDRLGFNYRLSDIACAIGLAQLERLDGMLADRARVAAAYREALGRRSRASSCRARTRGGERARLVRVRRPAAARRRPRRRRSRALRERGVQSKPYLPAIHLMSFYRERFGHREGEFPVCEDVAARSLALPFFPEMTEGQVARVAAALRDGPRPLKTPPPDVPLRRAAGPGLPARSTPRSASTGAWAPTTSPSRARTRACSPRRGSSPTDDRDELLRGARRRRARAARTGRSRSCRTTRTSTWRSSGA